MVEEIKKKKQTMRYSEEELNLIKGTFAENDDLLKTIRKVFYQMPLTAIDLSRLELVFHNKPAIQKVVRKTFLPQVEAELPIQQNIDLWLTVKIKDLMVQEAGAHLDSIQLWIDYIDQQLKVIETGKYQKKQKISFAKLVDIRPKKDEFMTSEQKFVKVLARNTIVNHVEQQLQQLNILAGLKAETPEETIERIHKDSSK